MKTVESVSKALNVLQLFSGSNDAWSLGEIAKSLEMDDATVSHIVSTLVMKGFLKQNVRRGKYFLGDRFLDLGGTINRDSRNTYGSMSYISELRRLVNESVHFTLWNGSNVSLNPSDYSYKISPYDWVTPVHCTATGKLILADMNEEYLDRYLGSKPLEKFTANTIVDIAQLKHHLTVVRREGIAFEDKEFHGDTSGVAAAIKNQAGRTIGAVFTVRPSARLTDAVLEKITPSLKACALKISEELRYSIGRSEISSLDSGKVCSRNILIFQ